VITEPGLASGESFGFAVAMATDGFVVAAPEHLLGPTAAGAVHRFDPIGDVVQVFVNPSPGGGFASFGHSTAVVSTARSSRPSSRPVPSDREGVVLSTGGASGRVRSRTRT
jgi:hypothetical protein